MIFSSTLAGLDQSIRRSTRKPRLNQDEKRCARSLSTRRRSGFSRASFRRSARSFTSVRVPVGARLRRRNSSWRLGSEAKWISVAAVSEPLFLAQSHVGLDALLRHGRTGGFTLAAEQCLAQFGERIAAPGDLLRFRRTQPEKVAAAIGDCRDKIGKEGAIAGTFLASRSGRASGLHGLVVQTLRARGPTDDFFNEGHRDGLACPF